jgi:hypothetical protein
MDQPAGDQAAWRAATEAELKRLHPDIRPSTIPLREWTRLYVRGLTPEAAAQQANVYAWNRHTPAERLRKVKETPRERLAETILEKRPPAPSVKRVPPKRLRKER